MLVIVPEEHKDVYWIYCGGLSILRVVINVLKSVKFNDAVILIG